MRLTKSFKIGKENIILSERNTQDIYNLIEYSQANFDKSNNKTLFNITLIAIKIEQSIRQSFEDFPKWKKFLFKKKYEKYNSSYLLSHLSAKEFSQLNDIVSALDGDDKKKVQAVGKESESVETLQKD